MANSHKSAIYGCGIDGYEMQRLVNCSGFKHSRLPFKYLGVPISTKKISTADCNQLIDKMVSRIRIWSTENISFAGRRQLVNYVLKNISVYWA